MDKSQNTIRARLKLKDALSIPNLMSYFRILLIPVFMVTYIRYHLSLVTFFLIVLSSLTDILDGIVARKFHMVTDWGKFMDPLADKLTQFCIMICLITQYKKMLYLAVFIFVKEVTTLVVGYLAFHNTGKVKSAEWHGKVTTILINGTCMAHFLWDPLPSVVSNALITVCGIMMVLSFVLYIGRYDNMLKEADQEEHE